MSLIGRVMGDRVLILLSQGNQEDQINQGTQRRVRKGANVRISPRSRSKGMIKGDSMLLMITMYSQEPKTHRDVIQSSHYGRVEALPGMIKQHFKEVHISRVKVQKTLLRIPLSIPKEEGIEGVRIKVHLMIMVPREMRILFETHAHSLSSVTLMRQDRVL